ncbi:MAG: MBL fold metallo-hydrolase [Polyangiaceae bacterium]|nr:MBL fold metallo-hydrolase [Polyangiaceae bacterium]
MKRRILSLAALSVMVAVAACAAEPAAESDEENLDAGWFQRDYAKLSVVPLGPGLRAVLGGGGNSVVIEGSGAALIVDTKCDVPLMPGASSFARWVASEVKVPISDVVNTHYHYDHAFGNPSFGGARVHVHPRAIPAMSREDGDFWREHPGAPLVPLTQETTRLDVGGRVVEVHHAGRAHTASDVWVYVPDENVVITGDLIFNGYFPFFDDTEDGSSLAGTASALRAIAKAHPTARIVPGHGALCTAADLEAYARFLDDADAVARAALAQGKSEREAGLLGEGRWDRKVLPSFHHGKLTWATSASTTRAAYRLARAGR